MIYELITGKILFPGTGDLEVLCNIFDVRGTPNVYDWPECEQFPNYLPFNEILENSKKLEGVESCKLDEIIK